MGGESTSNSVKIGETLIQWGYVEMSNSSATPTITFPISYSAAPSVLLGASTTTNGAFPRVYDVTTTTCTFARQTTGSTPSSVSVYWLAIGPA